MDRPARNRRRPAYTNGRALTLALTVVLSLCACGDDDTGGTEPPEADVTSPASVQDLAVVGTSVASITLEWTAPGNDGAEGRATEYDVRYARIPITAATWDSASSALSEPDPSPAGDTESFGVSGLDRETSYVFALKSRDEAENWSDISNNATGATLADENESWWDGFDASNALSQSASALLEYEGDLIVGGAFASAAGIGANRIARWNGSTWTALGQGMSGSSSTSSEVNALIAYQGDLIAAGDFATADGRQVNGIARWTGNTWLPLGPGVAGLVNALAVFQGDLFVGGQFQTAGGIEAGNLAAWNGSSWRSVGGGVSGGVLNQVFALTVHGERLAVGGSFTDAGEVEVNHIAYWDGSAWSDLEGGMTITFLSWVTALTVYGDNLIAAGKFLAAGGVGASQIAQWDGSSWGPLGAGIPQTELLPVETLSVYRDVLYVGGGFARVEDIAASRIARWDGEEWSAVGAGVSEATGLGATTVSAAAVFDGALYVGGNFTRAGNKPSFYIARWTN